MATNGSRSWLSAEIYARIEQEEEGIRDLITHEELILFDANGCVLERAKGDACSVKLKMNEYLYSCTWVSSHNHPIDLPMSQMDIESAIGMNVFEERVVTKYHTYRLIRPESTWPGMAAVARIINKAVQMTFSRFEEYQEFLTSLQRMDLSVEEITTLKHCLNQAYATLADWFKAAYIVEPRKHREG